MASSIIDLASGQGFLYMTGTDGTTIVSTEANTKDGARGMREVGAALAPIAARRSAYATITIVSCASAGNVTNIGIAGVNQLSGNVAIVTSTNSVLAATLANAINSFTPGSGYDYTAVANGAVITLYAPATAGAAPNGNTITFTASVGSTTATTTAFAGGSSETGVYDSSLGRRFWINSQSSAVQTSLSGAVEITKYIISRGLQTGYQTKDVTISSDTLTGLDRSCATTVLSVETQGGAASDTLAFIEVTDFVEGDIIMLRAYNTGHVVTVESAPTTTSAAPTPNIYLSNNASFITSVYNTLTLQLKYVAGTGNVWVENVRTITPNNAVIIRTQAQIATDITDSAVQVGGTYLITDAIDDNSAGTTSNIILQGVAANRLSSSGTGLFWNADYQGAGSYTSVPSVIIAGIWTAALGVTKDRTVVIWNNLHYVKIANSVNTATNPALNAGDWQLLPRGVTYGYILSADPIEYASVGTYAGYIMNRKDVDRDNDIDYNGIPHFMWGNDSVIENYWRNGAHSFINQFGTFVGTNLLSHYPITLTSNIAGNIIRYISSDVATTAAQTIVCTSSMVENISFYGATKALTITNQTKVTVIGAKYYKRVDWTFVNPSAVGVVTIPDSTIPNGAIVANNSFKFTGLTSAGAATVALGIATDDTVIFKAATAFATLNALKYTSQQSNSAITTADRSVIATVATADITAGTLTMKFEALIL